MTFGRIAVLAPLLLLSGCSYIYDVMATVIDGRLAFVSMDKDYSCVTLVYVTAIGDARAIPAPGDQNGMVVNGATFWWTGGNGVGCTQDFPVLYGEAVGPESPLVAPKELQEDVTYQVGMSGGGANGYGCFRLLSGGIPSNVHESECLPQN